MVHTGISTNTNIEVLKGQLARVNCPFRFKKEAEKFGLPRPTKIISTIHP